MIKIFLTQDGKLETVDKPQKGCWISLVHPNEKELEEIERKYKIESDDLRAALDEEETSRITKEDDYSMVLVDVPTIEDKNGKNRFSTIPMGIILA